jgi:hypothetical protein
MPGGYYNFEQDFGVGIYNVSLDFIPRELITPVKFRGKGWEMEWNGPAVLAKAIRAALMATEECLHIAVEHARSDHPPDPEGADPSMPGERFHSRTAQVIAATQILQHAVNEAHRYGTHGVPHVWGSWGIVDGPATQDPDRWREDRGYKQPAAGDLQDVSIKDRAMFLEFGTSWRGGGEKMAPRPFIYPAWDYAKSQYLLLLLAAYASLGGGRAGTIA